MSIIILAILFSILGSFWHFFKYSSHTYQSLTFNKVLKSMIFPERWAEYSDTLGNYRSSCGEGTYTITCSRWDYEDQVLSGLVVSEGSDLVLNIYLHQTGTDNQDNVQSYSETIHRIKNYPNPFNPTTTISFELTKAERVKVSIYNIKGQKITTLRDQVFPKGQQAILWNGKDDQQKSVSSGLYFIRLETETTHYVHKTMLVK